MLIKPQRVHFTYGVFATYQWYVAKWYYHCVRTFHLRMFHLIHVLPNIRFGYENVWTAKARQKTKNKNDRSFCFHVSACPDVRCSGCRVIPLNLKNYWINFEDKSDKQSTCWYRHFLHANVI